jgi:hypothetical protein
VLYIAAVLAACASTAGDLFRLVFFTKRIPACDKVQLISR